ncbi:MAG: hypothetical protein ABS58_10965 [Mesorhizobium sp. SCN 65-20]|nr:MAG: hypothetical protein ABS58_10965 [Mesorhizobium sp. SCN 65-20]
MYSLTLGKVSDAIAHFIGLLHTSIEEARQKQAFESFKAHHAKDPQLEDKDSPVIKVDASHDLENFDPNVPYLGPAPVLEPWSHWTHVELNPPHIPIPGDDSDVYYPNFKAGGGGSVSYSSSGEVVLPTIDPPGSVAVLLNQEIRLDDNDYVSVGGSGLKFTPPPVDGTHLAALHSEAANLSPIDDLTMPGSTQEIVALVTTAAARLNDFNPDGHGDANVFALKADVIEGTYVNGVLVDDDAAPKLKDYADYIKDPDAQFGKDDFSAKPDSSDFMGKWGDGTVAPSVQLDAGGNTVVNSAVIVNDWASSGVIATVGDYVELNAVVQINAIADVDSIGKALNDWTSDPSPNETFNIASFQRIDPGADAAPDPAATPDFPSYYVVTQVTGDLIMMNWVQQYSFVMDNDIAVLASSGVKTMVSTGDNVAINDLTLNNLGYYYDLIIVGGSVYDANIISQMNILIDNDLVGAVNGFESGAGQISTSGNLLWNQAKILNVGQGNDSEALPGQYKTAADNLAAGNNTLPSQILQDDAFSGMDLLRVLYVSGSIYNLQFIKQTTIVGDSDQVALAMNAVTAHPEAQWTINTGANELVNFAAVVDVDGAMKTYVGGQAYSDEILIQADLVSHEPVLGAQNPDALVNEAVAFLADGAVDSGPDPHADHASVPIHSDTGATDGMQSMIS